MIPLEEYFFRSQRGVYWFVECMVGWPLLTNSSLGRRCVRSSRSYAWTVDRVLAPPGRLIDAEVKRGMEEGAFDIAHLSREERERCLVNQDLGVQWRRVPAPGVCLSLIARSQERRAYEHVRHGPIWCVSAVELPLPGPR
jgi:hypothetical protein